MAEDINGKKSKLPRKPMIAGFLDKLMKRKDPETASGKAPLDKLFSKKVNLNKNLNKEFKKLNALKEKKIFAKKNKGKFTIRGFIRAIDLQENLDKAGMDTDAKGVAKKISNINLIICLAASLVIIILGLISMKPIFGIILFLAGFWLTVQFILLALIWVVFLFYLDMKIFQRTNAVELVFPDFLQLTSANISAGMPIDQALWYAVRPNFGVLAKEIETVAKNTMAGEDLQSALRTFAHKYDSKVIQRSINLMLEGMAAGGQMADLLSKIALDIEETRILKKDMAANVTTYVIFITFATIIAAPALFGLATQLLSIIKQITANMGSSMGGSTGFLSMSFSSQGIKVSDFKIFSYITLTISATASACIVSVIQKGRVKEGLSKIPAFILVSLLLYYLSSALMAGVFSGMF